MIDDKKINYGVIDYFSAYKVCDFKKSKNYIEKFSKLQCAVTELNFEDNIVKVGFKKDFEEFIRNIDTKKSLSGRYFSVLEDNVILMTKTTNTTSTYLGKSLSQFKYSYILQPILIEYKGATIYVNVKSIIYKCGVLIIQYTVPIENYEFNHLMTRGPDLLIDKASLPNYILEENSDEYEYKEINTKKIREVFNKYEQYIFRKIRIPYKSQSNFTNITLVNYDDMPNNFNSANAEIKKKIFWVTNFPFGILNERENTEYELFWKNEGYSASRYLRVFCSSNGRSTIILNKDIKSIKLDRTKAITFSDREIYQSSIDFISAPIENILIKKVHYNKLNENEYGLDKSLKRIRQKKVEIMEIEDLVFNIRNGGYSSVRLLQEYLEANLEDYLPTNFLANRFKSFEDITTIKEESLKGRYNSFFAFVAMIFPVVFGLEAVEYMVSKIKTITIFGNAINIEKQGVHIWSGLLLLIFLQMIFLFREEFSFKFKKVPFMLKEAFKIIIVIKDHIVEATKRNIHYKTNELEHEYSKWFI